MGPYFSSNWFTEFLALAFLHQAAEVSAPARAALILSIRCLPPASGI